jgi:hypothetical protein
MSQAARKAAKKKEARAKGAKKNQSGKGGV